MTEAPPNTHANARAWLVGGGIASLSAAAFLIRDAGVPGENICILEALPVSGGSLDGAPSPLQRGYVSRGGRMLSEEVYVCLWDLLASVPTLVDPSVSVKDEVWAFNRKWPTEAKARLIDKNHRIIDASELGFNARDRAELFRLLALPEHAIGARRIEDFFSEHFFETNFWCMWRTTFAFQNWHSAIELKRYLLRFIQEFPRIHTLAGVRRTRLNQYDSIVRPLQTWLTDRGLRTERGTTVTDVDFVTEGDGRRVSALRVRRGGIDETISLGANDYAFITLGSMTADATYGADDTTPELVRDKRDGGWSLWETIAGKAPDFGRPDAFDGDIEASKWASFTLTTGTPLLHRIEEFSGNLPGTGALMTFKDSSWLLSIVVPHAPHFAGQPEDEFTLWGYGLFVDRAGDFVPKTMSEATGREILIELVGHLGFDDALEDIRRTTSVTSVMMPYITSQFAPRVPEDRPLVVPHGSKNFAFLGQFVEIPEDVVFTVEYSVRAAMHAVYKLFGVKRAIPGIYHGLSNPAVAFQALQTLLG